MRVLVLISDRPLPAVTMPLVRNRWLWPALERLGVEVRVLGLDQRRAAPSRADAGEFFVPEREPLPLRAWHALHHSYHEWPVSPRLAERVADMVAAWRPDVVHAEELRMGRYLPVRSPGASTPLLSLALHNVEQDLLRRTGSSPVRWGRPVVEWLHARSLQRFERSVVGKVDVAFAYSAADRERYRQLLPAANWHVTRGGTDAAGITPAPQTAAATVLHLGSLSYAPNIRGLFWFLDHVLPRLGPNVTVTVAGSYATPAVRARLALVPVRFVDTPLDLNPLYADSAVSVVPVLEGSGTRGKILEALAYERVVISTTVGAEGLDLGPHEGVVIVDEAEDFAAQVRRLAFDRAARETLAHRGRAAVLARYDWSVVAAELLESWARCASR